MNGDPLSPFLRQLVGPSPSSIIGLQPIGALPSGIAPPQIAIERGGLPSEFTGSLQALMNALAVRQLLRSLALTEVPTGFMGVGRVSPTLPSIAGRETRPLRQGLEALLMQTLLRTGGDEAMARRAMAKGLMAERHRSGSEQVRGALRGLVGVTPSPPAEPIEINLAGNPWNVAFAVMQGRIPPIRSDIHGLTPGQEVILGRTLWHFTTVTPPFENDDTSTVPYRLHFTRLRPGRREPDELLLTPQGYEERARGEPFR